MLLRLSLLVGQQVFYGALWGSVLVSPLVRLPASVFIVTHFDRMVSLRQQTHMLGPDHALVVSFRFYLIARGPSGLLRHHHSPLWCSSSGEVTLSVTARFKRSGAEEHARGPALLLPLC